MEFYLLEIVLPVLFMIKQEIIVATLQMLNAKNSVKTKC